MKTAQYLDLAKKRLKIESDYALAPHVGLTKQAISKLRNGHSLVMSNTTAARIAEILDVDPMKVIADCELERGTNDELWSKIAKRVAVFALAGVGVALLAYLTGQSAEFNFAQVVTIGDGYGLALAPLFALSGPEIHIVSILAVLAAAWALLAPLVRPRGRARRLGPS